MQPGIADDSIPEASQCSHVSAIILVIWLFTAVIFYNYEQKSNAVNCSTLRSKCKTYSKQRGKKKNLSESV